MKYILTGYWCAIVGTIVFFIVKAICEGYRTALKGTGETVMAQDIIGMQVAPYIIAFIAILVVIKLRHE